MYMTGLAPRPARSENAVYVNFNSSNINSPPRKFPEGGFLYYRFPNTSTLALLEESSSLTNWDQIEDMGWSKIVSKKAKKQYILKFFSAMYPFPSFNSRNPTQSTTSDQLLELHH